MENTITHLLKDYAIKRNRAIMEAEDRKRTLLLANPKLSEIEKELAKISIQTTKTILQTNHSEQKKLLETLKKKSDELIKEKNKYLKELVADKNYLKPHFECKHCKDTGYLEKDGHSEVCSCLKQKIFDTYYNKSNVRKFKKRKFFQI